MRGARSISNVVGCWSSGDLREALQREEVSIGSDRTAGSFTFLPTGSARHTHIVMRDRIRRPGPNDHDGREGEDSKRVGRASRIARRRRVDVDVHTRCRCRCDGRWQCQCHSPGPQIGCITTRQCQRLISKGAGLGRVRIFPPTSRRTTCYHLLTVTMDTRARVVFDPAAFLS